jgi:putrescine aminotransferase
MPVCRVTTEEIRANDVSNRSYTTTTGGGALACAAAIAAIRVTLRDRLWEQDAQKGEYLIRKLEELAAQYPRIYEKITGRGLLIGMHFKTPEVGYKVAAELFKRGVLVAGTLTSARTIRVEPPLIISMEQLNTVLNRLEDSLTSVSRSI